MERDGDDRSGLGARERRREAARWNGRERERRERERATGGFKYPTERGDHGQGREHGPAVRTTLPRGNRGSAWQAIGRWDGA